MRTATHSTDREQLALNSEAVAELLGISSRHLRTLDQKGLIGPSPIRLGASVRWPLAELHEWLAAGGPPRDVWLARHQVERGPSV